MPLWVNTNLTKGKSRAYVQQLSQVYPVNNVWGNSWKISEIGYLATSKNRWSAVIYPAKS